MQKDYNQVLFQSGHIFMTTLWLSKIMVDLMCFKEHPRAITFFNKENRSSTLLKYRKVWRAKSHGDIVDYFILLFGSSGLRKEKIEYTLFLRNAIGHSFPSLGKEYIYIKPAHKRLISAFDKNITPTSGVKGKMKKINFFDYENYTLFRKYIIELDDKYFPYLAKEMNLKYTQIR